MKDDLGKKEKTVGSEVHDANQGTIQRASIQNLDVLVALEEACFSEPWSRKSFEAELEGNQFSRVLMIPHPEYGQKVQAIAYICAWVVFEEIRFLNLAVHQEFRRQGLASLLIGEAIRLGMEEGCCRGMLEVRETNDAAIKLYKYLRFKEYAKRKSYYTNPTEDAILMTLEPLAVLRKEDESGRSFGRQASIHVIS